MEHVPGFKYTSVQGGHLPRWGLESSHQVGPCSVPPLPVLVLLARVVVNSLVAALHRHSPHLNRKNLLRGCLPAGAA